MATRNIKDAKDLNTGELIYFKGHAQATFMSDGRTVEEAVSGISGGGGTNLTENDDITVRDINARDITAESLYGRVYANEIWDYDGVNMLNITDDGILIQNGQNGDSILQTITSGNGTKFLSDDGTYKTISSGGDSNAYKVITIEDYHWTVGTVYGPLLSNTKYICLNPLNQIEFIDEIVGLEDSWHGGVTDIYNEYTIIFEGNDCVLSLPDYILWANGVQPTIENGVRYELSIALMYINNEYIAHAILTPFKPIE